MVRGKKNATFRRRQAILVVGDDPFVREVTRTLIKELHHTVSVAEDGLDALDRLRDDPADLVVSDNSGPTAGATVPVMTGSEVITALRNEHPDMKILAISDTMLDPAAVRSVDAVLRKPFFRDEFLGVVRNLTTY